VVGFAPCRGLAQHPAPPPECTPTALDHVPIAVHALDQAEASYTALGFRLKPGRAHANGLRNAFAKFSEGSYLELISPERGATDTLAETYVLHLASGEGGAALALRADSLPALAHRLSASGVAVELERHGSAFATLAFDETDLRWLFLIEYTTPVFDPPELLEHPNTAVGIEAVWRGEGALEAVRSRTGALCVPGVHLAREAREGPPIRGVTLRVRSVRDAQRVLRQNGLDLPIRRAPRGEVLLVPPSHAHAHGLFLELLEPIPARRP
jgi:hypothetical protein